MALRDKVVSYTNTLLNIDAFNDYAPNGLQVEGRPEIRTLVSGVTASQALLEAAAAQRADAVLVHHGYFWRGENPCVTGMKYRRLRSLIAADINLLAYHLPLDAHQRYGNNVQLAEKLQLQTDEVIAVKDGCPLLHLGHLARPMTGDEFAEYVGRCLARRVLHLPAGRQYIERIAWCTGAAQDYFEAAVQYGVDAYLTGEVSEQTTHIARENDVHFLAAGHHATERFGVQALGAHLAEKFSLRHVYIEIENPV